MLIIKSFLIINILNLTSIGLLIVAPSFVFFSKNCVFTVDNTPTISQNGFGRKKKKNKIIYYVETKQNFILRKPVKFKFFSNL